MSAKVGTSRGRRRLLPELRSELILAEAVCFFAECGFSGSTRALASRLGITQALLYRYFPTKQDLIDRVFEATFAEPWDPAWDALLRDRGVDLATRLTRFYQAYHRRSSPERMRLWVRANLDGVNFAGRYSAPLTGRILGPIVGELRHLLRLPSLLKRSLMRGERELAMTLHGGIAFLGIRRYLYRTPFPDDVDDLVAQHVRAVLPGLRIEMRRLHGKRATPSLIQAAGVAPARGDQGLPSRTHLKKVKV
ncbi:MAG: TetR/AcrR family transcriptional regulator [Proteobacteria bacterium]|nr:TetR/AcrR family transcriptional regulator [Pseudomonadota bacterium]